MNCKQTEKLFSAYLEDELDVEMVRRLEQHLAKCATCEREWQAFRRTINLVSEMPTIAPSINFGWKLRSRLAQNSPVSLWRWLRERLTSRPALVFEGIAALLILFMGLYFYLSSPLRPPTDNEIIVRYIMPEISASESIDQWNDFHPRERMEAHGGEAPPRGPRVADERAKLPFIARESVPIQQMQELENVAPTSKMVNTNTNYVLETVSLTNYKIDGRF